MHEDEKNEEVSEHVERLVNYLKREETHETKKDGEAQEEAEDEDDLIVEV